MPARPDDADPSQERGVPQGGSGRFSPEFEAAKWKPGQTGNAGGIDKKTGIPGIKLRELLREKLEANRERLDRILEARLALCEPSIHIDPAVTLRAIDDLTEHLDGKLDKGVVNKGEVTVVNIHGPRPLPSPPPGK